MGLAFTWLILATMGFGSVVALMLQSPPTPTTKTASSFDKVSELRNVGGVMLIDGDNVRGKTRFMVSKEQLCEDVQIWSRYMKLEGRVGLVFDHATAPEAFYLEDSGTALIFSGPRKTGDDVITRDTGWILEELNCNVMVVTEDFGLSKRCMAQSNRVASKRQPTKRRDLQKFLTESTVEPPKVSFLGSKLFVEMMYGNHLPVATSQTPPEALGTGALLALGQSETALDPASLSADERLLITPRLRARAQLTTKEAAHRLFLRLPPRVAPGVTAAQLRALMRREEGFLRQIENLRARAAAAAAAPRAAARLEARAAQLEARLAAALAAARPEERALVACVREALGQPLESLVGGGGAEEASGAPAAAAEGAEVIRETARRVRGPRRRPEQTWERVVLAERMRRAVAGAGAGAAAAAASGGEGEGEGARTLAERYVRQVNRLAAAAAEGGAPR